MGRRVALRPRRDLQQLSARAGRLHPPVDGLPQRLDEPDRAAVTSVSGVDPSAVTDWLVSLGIQVLPPLKLEPLGQGKSNITVVATDAAGLRWVLRRPPTGDVLPTAHDVLREARIMRALEQTDVPAPRVLGMTDAPLLLLEHVDGLVIDEVEDAERLPLRIRRAIGPAMVRALAAIHSADLERTGLRDLASHKPFAPRQLRRWSSQWQASTAEENPVVDELARRLHAAVPAQREVTLVHGDFHIRNVILDPATAECRAVLDWELSTLGDPIADVGALLAYWPEAGDPSGAPFAATSLTGFSTRAELVTAYADASGRELESLGFWHTLALWKLAIILEGVRRRARDRGRPEPYDGSTAAWLLDRAAEAARGAGI